MWKYLQHVFPLLALSFPLSGSLRRSCRRVLSIDPEAAQMAPAALPCSGCRISPSHPWNMQSQRLPPGKNDVLNRLSSMIWVSGSSRKEQRGSKGVGDAAPSQRVGAWSSGARQEGFLCACWRDAGGGSSSPNQGLNSSDTASRFSEV